MLRVSLSGASPILHLFSLEDLQSASAIQMGNIVGVPAFTDEKRAAILKRLRGLDDASGSALKEALAIAAEMKNPYLIGYVLEEIAHAASLRYGPLNAFGVAERAAIEKALCRRAHSVAKDIFSAVGYEHGVADSLHNLANSLRVFGEAEEAKALNKQVIEMAKRLGYNRLLDRAEVLKRRLETGRVPDYVHGQGRDSV